jgi:hypothetical protein
VNGEINRLVAGITISPEAGPAAPGNDGDAYGLKREFILVGSMEKMNSVSKSYSCN